MSTPCTVLVVDDDPLIRELLSLHLGNAGYSVVLAEDAVAAGRCMLRQPPDLMLLDVDMPYMSGLEFFGVLSSDTRLPRFPVVFLTANPDGRDFAIRHGAAGYLAKPVLLPELLREVARHLPGARIPLS
jgi:CheY-like chemotaxis protein